MNTSQSAESGKILRLLRRAPKPAESAKLPRQGDSTLSYSITITPTAERAWELGILLEKMPMLNTSHEGPTMLKVLHCAGWTRIDAIQSGVFGQNFSIITDPQGGFQWADHTDGFYFQADKEQSLPLQFPRGMQASVQVSEGEQLQGRNTKLATVSVSTTPPVNWRIWFTNDPLLMPFVRSVYCLMLGCPDSLADAGLPSQQLLQLGIPLKMEVLSAPFGNATLPLLTSKIDSIVLVAANPGDFMVPQHYRDLRKSQQLAAGLGQQGFHAPYPGTLEDIRPGFSETAQVGVTGVIDADPNPSPPPGGATTDTLQVPQCFDSTFGSQTAMVTNKILYDDLKFLINGIFSRLDQFNGSGGTITIDWLNQWSNSPKVMDGTDSLFCLLRDTKDDNPTGENQGQGLLDKLAERQVRKALLNGTLITQLSAWLTPALLYQLTLVMGLDPARRFDALSPDIQTQIRHLYLFNKIGTFAFTYSNSTSPETIFYGLMDVQFSDIEFSIAIHNTNPIETLEIIDNTLHLVIELPNASVHANVGRSPSGAYWIALGAATALCFVLPPACVIAPRMVDVALFLLSDYAYVRVSLNDLSADITIDFEADALKVLRPKAKVKLNAKVVDPYYMSYVPTGVNQLESLVIGLVGKHTDLVMNEIESQVEDALNKLLVETLDLSFPPKFGPVPFTGLTSYSDGATGDFLFLQAGLDGGAVGVSGPYITQVDPNVEARLLDGRVNFPSTTFREPLGDERPAIRGYGGFVLSQNFINQYINALWRTGSFNYQLSTAEVTQVALILKRLVPLSGRLKMHLWPAVTPRTVFTPRGGLEKNAFTEKFLNIYATTFFDDLRLCISSEGQHLSTMEIQFAAQAYTQIGFGSEDPGTKKLDIIRVTDSFTDIFFDLARLNVQLIHPEVQGIRTNGPVFESLRIKSLPALEPMMLMALRFALASRDDSVIPSVAGDPMFQQYPIPGATIDLHLSPLNGNLFGWMQLNAGANPDSSLLAFLENGFLAINAGTCGDGQLARKTP